MLRQRATISILLALMAAAEIARGDEPIRVTITTFDENRKPVACRIHITDASGKPVRAGKLPFWKDHFASPGEAEVQIPRGPYRFQIERGPEYRRIESPDVINEGDHDRLAFTFARIANLAQEGWHSGDLHVHRPIEDIPLLMQAEDLDFAPVITWWNQRNLWAREAPPANPLRTIEGGGLYNVLAGEDEREGGALLFFGLKQPLPIADATREYPSPMKFIEMARAQNPNAWVDIEKPFWWDVPVWLALGKIDSIGIANNHMCRDSMYENEAWGKPRDASRLPAPQGNGYWSQEIYYHVLNTGLRVPPSAGSASGVLPNPVGYNRVYVFTGTRSIADSHPLWWEGLRAGRSFVTNGPLLRVQADGHPPGHIFRAAKGETISIALRAKLTTQDEIEAIEVVQNGEIVRKIPYERGADDLNLGTLEMKTSGWFLVRAIANHPRTFRFASTAPYYVEIGEAKERISRRSSQFFLDWVNERAERVKLKLKDPEQLGEVLTYHNKAREFWKQRVNAANVE